jgi:superfamily II RNA helicase
MYAFLQWFDKEQVEAREAKKIQHELQENVLTFNSLYWDNRSLLETLAENNKIAKEMLKSIEQLMNSFSLSNSNDLITQRNNQNDFNNFIGQIDEIINAGRQQAKAANQNTLGEFIDHLVNLLINFLSSPSLKTEEPAKPFSFFSRNSSDSLKKELQNIEAFENLTSRFKTTTVA